MGGKGYGRGDKQTLSRMLSLTGYYGLLRVEYGLLRVASGWLRVQYGLFRVEYGLNTGYYWLNTEYVSIIRGIDT